MLRILRRNSGGSNGLPARKSALRRGGGVLSRRLRVIEQRWGLKRLRLPVLLLLLLLLLIVLLLPLTTTTNYHRYYCHYYNYYHHYPYPYHYCYHHHYSYHFYPYTITPLYHCTTTPLSLYLCATE